MTPAEQLLALTKRAKQVCFNEGVLSGRLLNELMKEAAAKRERKQTKRLNDQQAHPTMIRVNERTLHGPAQR